MAQFSLPWPGVAPGDGPDAGPYTAAQWWGRTVALLQASGMLEIAPVLKSDRDDVGVCPHIGNDLAVTNPANQDIRIDTGAAAADGTVHYNDAALTLTIPLPTVNPRIDRIVVRKNYTAAVYDPAGDAGDEEVPGYTMRITRLVGVENVAPAAPALTQDTGRATYWDIPLAQFQISVGGVVSGLIDEREFVGPEVDGVTLQSIAGVLSIAADGVNTTQLADNAVTDAKLRDSAALSVIGRASNSVGDPADIVAATDHHVLRRSGGTLGFGLVGTDNIGTALIAATHHRNGAFGNWGSAGTTNHVTNTPVRLQGGVHLETLGAPAASGTITIAFPQAFAFVPLVIIANSYEDASNKFILTRVDGVNTTDAQAVVKWATSDGGNVSAVSLAWIAMETLV